MTELELLQRGIVYHEHIDVAGDRWFCRSPYCESKYQDEPLVGPSKDRDPASYRLEVANA